MWDLFVDGIWSKIQEWKPLLHGSMINQFQEVQEWKNYSNSKFQGETLMIDIWKNGRFLKVSHSIGCSQP